MCSLWQRMGRGARDQSREATAVLFTESKVFDSVRAEKEEKKKRREEAKSRKRAAPQAASQAEDDLR